MAGERGPFVYAGALLALLVVELCAQSFGLRMLAALLKSGS